MNEYLHESFDLNISLTITTHKHSFNTCSPFNKHLVNIIITTVYENFATFCWRIKNLNPFLNTTLTLKKNTLLPHAAETDLFAWEVSYLNYDFMIQMRNDTIYYQNAFNLMKM